MTLRKLKVRYARVEDGEVVNYDAGSSVELTDDEAAKLGPDAFDDVEVDVNKPAPEVIDEIKSSDDPAVVKAIADAEKGGKERTSVLGAAEHRLEELAGEEEDD